MTGGAPELRNEGIRCPGCHCRHLIQVFTRHSGSRTVRVRECRHCGRRVRTTEMVVFEYPKKDEGN